MRISETSLGGLCLVEADEVKDERGGFVRTFCAASFIENGLELPVCQFSISKNTRRYTLRGMHFQASPAAEIKLVRCISGAIFDVAIDLREDSPTFRQWFGVELNEENNKALYIPEGFAHGFLTLRDHSHVAYQMNVPYQPEFARAVRWNDRAFKIDWPFKPEVMSSKDQLINDFTW